MSDFLAHLILRTIRGADVVRPRFHSLFEPSPVNDHILTESPPNAVNILPEQETRDASPEDRVSQLDIASTEVPQGNVAGHYCALKKIPPEPVGREGSGQQQAPELRKTNDVGGNPGSLPEIGGNAFGATGIVQANETSGRRQFPPSSPKRDRGRHNSLVDVEAGHIDDVTQPVSVQMHGRGVAGGSRVRSKRISSEIKEEQFAGRVCFSPGERLESLASGETATPAFGPVTPTKPIGTLSTTPEREVDVPRTVRKGGADASEVAANSSSSLPPRQHGAPESRCVIPASVALSHPPQPAARSEASAPGKSAIQVTIGRVEVRATPPNVVQSRPSSPVRAPAMTLEEYLRTRSGEGTR